MKKTNVKHHLRRTKKKIVPVRQHKRKVKPVKKKVLIAPKQNRAGIFGFIPDPLSSNFTASLDAKGLEGYFSKKPMKSRSVGMNYGSTEIVSVAGVSVPIKGIQKAKKKLLIEELDDNQYNLAFPGISESRRKELEDKEKYLVEKIRDLSGGKKIVDTLLTKGVLSQDFLQRLAKSNVKIQATGTTLESAGQKKLKFYKAKEDLAQRQKEILAEKKAISAITLKSFDDLMKSSLEPSRVTDIGLILKPGEIKELLPSKRGRKRKDEEGFLQRLALAEQKKLKEKKPGRPKKKKFDLYPEFRDADFVTVNKKVPIKQKKKGRGRPKKVKDDFNPILPKKGVGRPGKLNTYKLTYKEPKELVLFKSRERTPIRADKPKTRKVKSVTIKGKTMAEVRDEFSRLNSSFKIQGIKLIDKQLKRQGRKPKPKKRGPKPKPKKRGPKPKPKIELPKRPRGRPKKEKILLPATDYRKKYTVVYSKKGRAKGIDKTLSKIDFGGKGVFSVKREFERLNPDHIVKKVVWNKPKNPVGRPPKPRPRGRPRKNRDSNFGEEMGDLLEYFTGGRPRKRKNERDDDK